MLTILACKLFHIKRLTQECEWIGICYRLQHSLDFLSRLLFCLPGFHRLLSKSLCFGYEICVS